MNLESLMQQVNDKISASAREAGQWTLGDLRGALRMLPSDTKVVTDGGLAIGELSSYRGYYERLSLNTYAPRGTTEVMEFSGSDIYDSGLRGVQIATGTAADLLAALDLADGQDFEGWKGGTYGMHGGTWLHVATGYGDCGPMVVGLRLREDGAAEIETREEER